MTQDDKDFVKLYTSYLEKELRLDAQGVWHHDGTPFSHKRLSQLFHRSIKWDTELKNYVLRIGQGRATFQHEERVRFITSLEENSDKELLLRLADGSEQKLSPNLLRLNEDEEFVLLPKDEKASEENPLTYFTRHAQQLLLSHAESERALQIGGNLYTIPFLEE